MRPILKPTRVLLAALLLLAAAAARAGECRVDSVEIKGGFGEARFAVEIADDADAIASISFEPVAPTGAAGASVASGLANSAVDAWVIVSGQTWPASTCESMLILADRTTCAPSPAGPPPGAYPEQ